MVSVMKSYAGQLAADGAQAASNGGSGGRGDKGGFHGAARATAAAASAAVSFQPRAALSCLRVLCAVGGRAPWAAERVASEPGLLDAVREVCMYYVLYFCVECSHVLGYVFFVCVMRRTTRRFLQPLCFLLG